MEKIVSFEAVILYLSSIGSSGGCFLIRVYSSVLPLMISSSERTALNVSSKFVIALNISPLFISLLNCSNFCFFFSLCEAYLQ